MLFEIDAIAFDLDGTLVDSVPDLAHAIDATLGELGYPQAGEQRVRHWVGNGVARLVKRALTGDMERDPDADLFDRAFAIFNRYYAAHVCVASRVYPGVTEALQRLVSQGYPLACVTNKASKFALPLLEALDLDRCFDVILGGDATQRHKPAPDALLLAAERLGVAPRRMLFVGDSLNDVGAARNAGCPVVCVPYGYNHGHDIRDAQPDYVIERVAELPELLLRVA